jgi:hypothetical protein
MRRQLSYGMLSTRRLFASPAIDAHLFTDMWWLALALFLICIAEVRIFPPPFVGVGPD